MNTTQLVRTSINIFIMVAIGISLFQELNSLGSRTPSATPAPIDPKTGQALPTQMTGPKVEGTILRATDKEQQQLKQILIRNHLNIDIQAYEFQGNEYYLNLVLNWGHIVVIYVLMGKYKSEENPDTKKKLLVVGAVAVVAWFGAATMLKPKRLALEHNGMIVYERDYLNENELMETLGTYEFEFDDLKEAQGAASINPEIVKEDAWDSEAVKVNSEHVNEENHYQYEEEIF